MAKKLGVSLDRDQVKDYVTAAADKYKVALQKEIKDKFVHLKFDCATR
jgi:hypothetical protein